MSGIIGQGHTGEQLVLLSHNGVSWQGIAEYGDRGVKSLKATKQCSDL